MKDQLTQLLALQNRDLALDKCQVEIDQIQDQLQDHKDILQKLIDDLGEQKNQLQETVELKAKRAEELREAEERHGKSKERLMSVSSAKEYNALEKEMEQLKRKTEETREQLDHLKERTTHHESEIAKKEVMINELREQIEQTEADATKKLTDLNGQLENAQSEREKMSRGIQKPILRRYDFIRTRRGGTAIVSAKDGHCEGCFMRLPPQMYIELQRGNTLITCPSCQRILYHAAALGIDEA